MEKLFDRFWKWLLLSIVIAFIIHCIFQLRTNNDFFVAVWSAGDILTYFSTVLLAWIAYCQNERYKEAEEKHREESAAIAQKTEERFLRIQENIERQTQLISQLEDQKLVPFIRISHGLTNSGRMRRLTVSKQILPGVNQSFPFSLHLKNVGINGILDINCVHFSINGMEYIVSQDVHPFGIDPAEVCFLIIPSEGLGHQTIQLVFEVLNIIGCWYTVEYILELDGGNVKSSQMLNIAKK